MIKLLLSMLGFGKEREPCCILRYSSTDSRKQNKQFSVYIDPKYAPQIGTEVLFDWDIYVVKNIHYYYTYKGSDKNNKYLHTITYILEEVKK